MSTGSEARRILRGCRDGALSTLSRTLDGWPFGSVAPFVTDHHARPILLVSTLAEHTRNMAADPRVSLLVQEDARGGDVQAAARITLAGHAAPLAADENLRARYVRYQPQAADLLALGDFGFYAITPLRLRYIGGFGKIHWVSGESYAPPANNLAEAESDIVEHMNADHAYNLRDYCRHFKGSAPAEVNMAGIDCDGFDLRADGALLRFDFETPVLDAAGARRALVAMAKLSRGA